MRTPCDEGVIQAQSPDSPCGRSAQAWVLAATIAGSSMAFIDSTIVNVALPALQNTFGAGLAGMQWVVESYALTLAALMLVGGSTGDLFGRRRMFVVGVTIFAIASAACGLATSIEQLIAARAIQGIGAAFLVPGSLALISASFTQEERGRAIGTWSGSTAITTAIGPVLGGWLIQHLSWRWAFFVNVPMALVVIAISLWRVPESRSQRHERIDWAGALAAIFSLGAIVFGFIESSSLGWKRPLVPISLLAGIIGGLVFLWIETRAAFPMFPLSLFHSKAFRGANLLTFLLYAAIGMFFFLLPLDLIQAQGYSPTAAGAAILPLILLIFLLSRWSGGLVDRYGAQRPLIFGPLLTACGFLLFAIPSLARSYWSSFFPAVLVLGLGMAMSVAPLTTVVMNGVALDRAGTASGINNAVSRVAGLLAIAVFGVVMAADFGSHLNRELASLSVPPEIREQLRVNENRMAALKPPALLDAPTSAAIQSAIIESFVQSFRLIMWICAVLAISSAGVAWRMIPARPRANVFVNSVATSEHI